MNDGQETNAVIEIMKGNDNPVADFFFSSSTPETDDQPIIYAINDNGYQVPCVDLEFACRLDRERVEEALKELSSIHQWIDRNHPDGFIDSLTYFQNLERVTDNWYDRLDRLEVDAKRFVRERDEAIFSKNTSASDFLKQIGQITLCKDVAREKLLMAEKERDETRKQFVDFLNKTEDYKRERDEAREDVMELQDIKRKHEHEELVAAQENDRLKQERDEARHKLELCMAANSDVARIAKERNEALDQVKELIYIAERAIALAEIDFENDKFSVVSELRAELEQLKEGAK